MSPNARNALLPVAIGALAGAVTGVLALAPPAAAAEAPDYREDGPVLLVCTEDAQDFAERNDAVAYNQRIVNERLYEDCLEAGHRDLAGALDAVEAPGTRIQILPGRYDAAATVLVDGEADLQIEGLGDSPDDVHLSAGYTADAVIEAREATGLYLKGFTVGQGRETGLLLRGAAGAVLDGVRAVHNGGPGLHVADSTAVRLTGCRAEGNDGAGIDLEDSDAEAAECESTGNLIGLRERGGDVVLESNRLHGNTTGLIVSGTGEGHRLEASGNLVFDNNADHYTGRDDGRCDAEPAQRDWTDGRRCPAESAPVGVGVLIDGGNDAALTGNHVWGQDAAAVMVWGAPGADDAGSHRNRFEDNTFGYRDDGQRSRNRLDVWWDGKGEGNCFTEPTAGHTTPAVLPACGRPGPERVLAEPVKAFKVWHCGTGSAEDGALPAGCDWFGARFTDRLEVQAAVAFAAALLFLTGAGWFGAVRAPLPPPPMSMTFSAIATGAGALLLVLASWTGRSDYEALAIGLWGFGWALAGRSWFTAGLGAFGSFTALIGGLAVLDAVDRGLWTVPVVPVAPAWMWVVLLPVWVLLAIGAVFRPRVRERPRPPVQRTPATVPARDRFDW